MVSGQLFCVPRVIDSNLFATAPSNSRSPHAPPFLLLDYTKVGCYLDVEDERITENEFTSTGHMTSEVEPNVVEDLITILIWLWQAYSLSISTCRCSTLFVSYRGTIFCEIHMIT